MSKKDSKMKNFKEVIESDVNDDENNGFEDNESEIDDLNDNNSDIGDDQDYEDVSNDLFECNIEKAIEDDNIYFGNIIDSDVEKTKKNIIVRDEERISKNRLTKYELTRIISERTKQLTTGAPPLVKNYKTFTYEEIAVEELRLNMIPFKIKRPLPNGKIEIWRLDELMKDHLTHLMHMD